MLEYLCIYKNEYLYSLIRERNVMNIDYKVESGGFFFGCMIIKGCFMLL